MRIPDNRYHKLARVQFIYADSLSILANLGIDDVEAYLHYEASATDILLKPGVLLKNHLFDIFCKDADLAQKLADLQKERRRKLISAHKLYGTQSELDKSQLEDLFSQHFGYEQLVIDKLVNEEGLFAELSKYLPPREAQRMFGNLLIPFDGKTFFEESNIIRLKHIGYLLDPDHPLTAAYNADWYKERSLTRYRIYDILENYLDVVQRVSSEIDVVKDVFDVKTHEDAINRIRGFRYKQSLRRGVVQDSYGAASEISDRIANYLQLLQIALPYNEDVRLQRSVSFDIFSRNAIKNGFHPKGLYREFQIARQQYFALKYRPEQYSEIMSEKLIEHLGAEK